MPYIDKDSRPYFDTYLDPLGKRVKEPGAFTYVVYKLMLHYVANCGKRFAIFAEMFGGLEAAKMEFYRRVAVDYEEDKKLSNGDVTITKES